MTGPDCAVMCNLIIYTHAHILSLTHTLTQTYSPPHFNLIASTSSYTPYTKTLALVVKIFLLITQSLKFIRKFRWATKISHTRALVIISAR